MFEVEAGADEKQQIKFVWPNRYLDMITDPQIAFAVRQGSPRTVEEAVTATLRRESYKIKSFKATPVHLIDEAATSIGGRTIELKYRYRGGR